MNSITWIRHSACAGLWTVLVALFVASAAGGQIQATPGPTTSGTGLGLVNVAAIITPSPNNDDEAGTSTNNNVVSPLKRFDSTGFIDIEFTVTPTQGVSEYLVTEFVDNNTGVSWTAYNMLLGFGTGASFTQVGGLLDGLDFDTGPPGGNTAPPSSASLPTINRPNEDSLNFSGGIQGLGAQLYTFRIDVPDLVSRGGKFTLRQQPVPVPEPNTIVFVSLAIVGLAMKRRGR